MPTENRFGSTSIPTFLHRVLHGPGPCVWGTLSPEPPGPQIPCSIRPDELGQVREGLNRRGAIHLNRPSATGQSQVIHKHTYSLQGRSRSGTQGREVAIAVY